MKLAVWLEKHFEEAICCLCIAIIAVCVFAQIVLRYAFNSNLHGAEEITAVCMVWAVYTGAALCVRERFHIRILVGAAALPIGFGRVVVLVADLFLAGFCLFMIRVSVDYLAVLWRYPSYSASLGINDFYPQTILVIGYGLILLRLIQQYVAWWRGDRTGMASVRPEDLGMDTTQSKTSR